MEQSSGGPSLSDARVADRAADDALRRTLVRSFMPFVAACARKHAVLDRVAERYRLEAHQLGLPWRTISPHCWAPWLPMARPAEGRDE